MIDRKIDGMITAALRQEGGYINHSLDKSRPTNYGITRAVLETKRGHQVTVEDVRTLPVEEAHAIYRDQYYRGPKIDTLPVRIQPQLFDMAVTHGPRTAIRLLQGMLHTEGYGPLSVDGFIGPGTWTASKTAVQIMGGRMNNAMVDARVAFYQGIVERQPSQRVFLNSWVRRAEAFREDV